MADLKQDVLKQQKIETVNRVTFVGSFIQIAWRSLVLFSVLEQRNAHQLILKFLSSSPLLFLSNKPRNQGRAYILSLSFNSSAIEMEAECFKALSPASYSLEDLPSWLFLPHWLDGRMDYISWKPILKRRNTFLRSFVSNMTMMMMMCANFWKMAIPRIDYPWISNGSSHLFHDYEDGYSTWNNFFFLLLLPDLVVHSEWIGLQ